MKQSQFYYLLRRGLFGGGGIWAKYVNDFKARVIADGGTMESPSCAKTDVKFLVQNPEPVAFTGLLNDYSGADAAYSLRLLDNTYTGDAIVVTTNGSDSQSIGFVNNELDTASLEAFANGGDAYVSTWFDQSGLGNNATQTTFSKMPKIVSSGSTILENGKAAVQFDGNDIIDTSSITHGTDDISIIGVFMNELNTGDQSFISGVHASGMQWSRIRNNSWSPFLNTGTSTYSFTDSSFNINQQYLFGSYYASDWNVYANNQNLDTKTIGVHDDIGSGRYTLGALFNNTDFLQGNIQEVIVYSNDQSTNRSGIETNINDFYSIY